MSPTRYGRGRGGRRGNYQRQNKQDSNVEPSQNVNDAVKENNDEKPESDANLEDWNSTPENDVNVVIETENDIKQELPKEEPANGNGDEKTNSNAETANKNGSIDLPYKVKVTHLPASYASDEFQKYLRTTLDIYVPKIISPGKNSPWVLLPFATKAEQDNCVKILNNHFWKKKALKAMAFYGIPANSSTDDGPDKKKMKTDDEPIMTLEMEVLSESLPWLNVPYEEQNKFTIDEVKLLSDKLHAFMCVRNPALAGWAEAMIEKNDGSLFKIEPLKPATLLEGYRNKCKFRVGKNTEGETTVGFCLNDNENKILGVQPGDKLIHLPDSMKYAAKKFEKFVQSSGKQPYDKKLKSGFWDHIIIRVTPEDTLMLVVVMYHNKLSKEAIDEIKNEVKEFFVNGDGKDCKVMSLYFQIMNDKTPMLLPKNLELLHGESHFYENICGLKFYVGPFSNLNVNPTTSESIYESVAELAEPTPETIILDLCCGAGCIDFTLAGKCKKVVGIETQEDHIKDALKTSQINNIENITFIKGKVEDVLDDVFNCHIGDAPVIPVFDPPRQRLGQKAISVLRGRENITKLVYVCSNSKTGVKNFLDLCAAAEKKDGNLNNASNVALVGLPFLPVRAIPIDVAPHTVNKKIVFLFERTDPSVFPPAKNPPPQPVKKIPAKKDEKKRRRLPMRRRDEGRNKKFRSSNVGMRSGFRGPNFQRSPQQQRGGFMQNLLPQPLMRSLEPTLSLVAKYERRIAELEQQDRAFKAGLTMGLQALGTRGSHSGSGADFQNFGGAFNTNLGDNLGNYQNQIIGDNPAWQRGGGGGGNRSFENLPTPFGGNNLGSFVGSNSGRSGGGFNNFNDSTPFVNFRGGPAGRGGNLGGRGGSGGRGGLGGRLGSGGRGGLGGLGGRKGAGSRGNFGGREGTGGRNFNISYVMGGGRNTGFKKMRNKNRQRR